MIIQNTIEYFDSINHPNAKLIRAFVQNQPILNILPTLAPLVDGRQVKITSDTEYFTSSTMQAGDSSSDSTISGESKTNTYELLERYVRWSDKDYILNTPSAGARTAQRQAKALVALGNDVNSAIINGSETAVSATWAGLDEIVTTSCTETHGTAVSTKALANTAYKTLKTAARSLWQVDAIATSQGGIDELWNWASHLGTWFFERSNSEIGGQIGWVHVDGKRLPVIHAGRTSANAEVITESSSATYYLLNLSDSGLGYAWDGEFHYKEIDTIDGQQNKITIYDRLVAATDQAVAKFTQTV